MPYSCRHVLLAAGFWAALVTPVLVRAADNPDCEPNPLFSKFKGEVLGVCERARFAELELWRSKNRRNPRGESEQFKVEGEYWYYFNELPADDKGRYPGTAEVRRNFENAVVAAKGELLLVEANTVVWHLRKGDAEFWGQSGCGAGDATQCTAVMHKFVRVAAMEQSVVVSAEKIEEGMRAEGRVAFYGIYFDTDKAVVKPESAPTVAEIAKWLAAHPKAAVYVVGHTDMRGQLDKNRALSRDRAAAVVAMLVDKHGIAKERLIADGVGPLAPVASNDDDAGRAKNRRVELVLR